MSLPALGVKSAIIGMKNLIGKDETVYVESSPQMLDKILLCSVRVFVIVCTV